MQLAKGTPRQNALGWMWHTFYLARAKEIEAMPKDLGVHYWAVMLTEYVIDRQAELAERTSIEEKEQRKHGGS